MPHLTIINREPAWPDLKDRQDELLHAETMQITGLEQGMESGKPSVALRIDFEDGQIAIAETSLQLFLAAADALKARHGEPREGMDDADTVLLKRMLRWALGHVEHLPTDESKLQYALACELADMPEDER